MALSAGTRLGPYEILAPLGAGGMGEVYRATDTKLGREVAIKVLPAEMASDSGRLERLQREAHLLASLNHPHIAAIYGLEEADGQPFLVLELVEGEDLKERLVRGALPVDEALDVARQIAEALEKAHNTGIIHRDLKPANVKLTPDGEVKVLDFGLAKAWAGDATEGETSSASMSQSPTLAHSGTEAGVILGTAAYMSPEQARGKPVDKRGDVWAFGVLLWEMLTGRVLFAGETVTDIIAAVVKEEPDLEALPAETPPLVRRLIVRCLRKDPRTRLPDVGAARLELQELLGGTVPEETRVGTTEDTGLRERSQRVRERWAWAGVWLLTATVAAYLAFVPTSESPTARSASHFVIDAPEGWSFYANGWPLPSPDGRHILMLAVPKAQGSGLILSPWLRSLASPTPRRLTSMEPVAPFSFMFWSPDSRFIGFVAEGELRKINIADGFVQTICTMPTRGLDAATWSADGTIVFSGYPNRRGLYVVPSSGGEPKLVLEPDAEKGEDMVTLPQFLPDGRRFLFWAAHEQEGSKGVRTFISSLDNPDDRRLLMADPVHLVGNYVVFNREGTLVTRRFDPRRGEVRGEPVRIGSSVTVVGSVALGAIGVSPEGTLAYLVGEREDRFQLTWVDREGARIETVGTPGVYQQIALSPDERRVAVEIPGDEGHDLWVIDVARGVASRLTSDPGAELDPVWSPDSQEVAYGSFEGGRGLGLFRKGLSGEPAQPIPIEYEPNAEFRPIPHSWSSDGKTMFYKMQRKGWAFPMAGDGEAEVVLNLDVTLNKLRISPDGRWLAYLSEESGKMDVYVRPFRRAGERVRVSRDGGASPRWRRDSKELFYQTPDGMLMAVEVSEGTAGPEVSPPAALFDAGPFQKGHDYYGVSADGQRFLVRVPVETDRKIQMHVVLNWESLLDPSGE